MPIPLLIDSDMGVDDAVALVLALCSPELNVVGLASVGGNVPLEQATGNIGRVLSALGPRPWPPVARGLDQEGDLQRATHVFGSDGLGEVNLPVPPNWKTTNYVDLYERLTSEHEGELVIVAIGPLTNLAALLRERPDVLHRAARIVIMGGAIWCPGNVTPFAEFNIYRDPRAAAEVFAAGLPLTLVPLDITRQVALDESHMAHLSRSGTRGGDMLARMIDYPIARGLESIRGKFLVHDALAVGFLLWPELFIQARMGIQVTIAGQEAGRCRPQVVKDKTRQIGTAISVNVVDFMENLLESLCQERFVV